MVASDLFIAVFGPLHYVISLGAQRKLSTLLFWKLHTAIVAVVLTVSFEFDHLGWKDDKNSKQNSARDSKILAR